MKANAFQVISYEIDDDGENMNPQGSELPSDIEEEEVGGQREKPEEMPDSLKAVFAKKTADFSKKKQDPSIFRKVRGEKTLDLAADSKNVQEEAMKKAEELLKSSNVFNNVPLTGASISPLNNIKLKAKERREDREKTAGRAWGEMPKVELTEELKADLKALQLRNFIYPNRFYKTNDSKKLPKYFQIGTVVTDKNDMRTERLTKKEAKGSLAQQFLKDDEAR
jgi:hypothetical protein